MSIQTLNSAIEMAGSQSALADVISKFIGRKIAQGNVWAWLKSPNADHMPPAEYVIPICRGLGYRITPHELRPDIYPHPDDGMRLAA